MGCAMIVAVERVSDAAPAAAPLEIGQLLKLACHLPTEDQALLEAVYECGMKRAAMARAMRCTPKVIQRRLRGIVTKLKSPAFRFVLAQAGRWPERRRLVAHAVICRSLTHRQAAVALGLTLHQVRMEMARVNALCALDRERNDTARR